MKLLLETHDEVPLRDYLDSDLIRWLRRKGFVLDPESQSGGERWGFTAPDGSVITAETASRQGEREEKRSWRVYLQKPGLRAACLYDANERILGYLLPTLDEKWMTQPGFRAHLRRQGRAAEREERAQARRSPAS